MKGPNDEFEQELTLAMKRFEAPAQFLAATMEAAIMEAAIQERRSTRASGRVLLFPQWQRWIGSVAASLLLAGGLFSGIEHRRAVERQRAERDFAQTLQITDRAMQHTRQELRRAGFALDE